MLKTRLKQLFHSIRLRLVLSYLLVTLLSVGLMGALGMLLIHYNAVQQEEQSLSLAAEMARSQLLPLLMKVDLPGDEIQNAVLRVARMTGTRVQILSPGGEVLGDSGHAVTFVELQALADRMAEQGDVHVVIRDDQGNVLAESGTQVEMIEIIVSSAESPSAGSLITGDQTTVLENGSLHPGHITNSAEGDQQLPSLLNPARSGGVKMLPIQDGGQMLGTVRISEGPRLVGSVMDAASQAFMMAGYAAIFVSLLVGLLVSRRISAPLVKLTQAVNRMGSGDLAVQPVSTGQDEVGVLGQRFNEMSSQLAASFAELKAERDALQRFVADAAHELRTPITALQMFIELLNESDEGMPEEQQELLADSQAEVARLAWITNNLLDLSRMDAGIVQLDVESCRAVDLLEAACSEFRPKAQGKGIDLQLEQPPAGLVLSCDRQRLKIALANLLENAIKYTREGGWVKAGAQSAPGEIGFWVEDNGAGIYKEDLPHIYDRFYRGKDRSVPGSGLGLAIVRGIVELHHGHVEVQSESGQGTRVSIWLPLNMKNSTSPQEL